MVNLAPSTNSKMNVLVKEEPEAIALGYGSGYVCNAHLNCIPLSY